MKLFKTNDFQIIEELFRVVAWSGRRVWAFQEGLEERIFCRRTLEIWAH